MTIFGAQLPQNVASFFVKQESSNLHFNEWNCNLQNTCGIIEFFSDQTNKSNFFAALETPEKDTPKNNRLEFGDFQTNRQLTGKICQLIEKKNIAPETIIEPTCGTGNFVVAALSTFNQLKSLYAIEINPVYFWQTKLNILSFYLQNLQHNKPKIRLYNTSIFEFDLERHFGKIDQPILILGNPPWVTNSALSAINSQNLPKKSNHKKYSGIDAITGKGNFDIAEYISNSLLAFFSGLQGNLAFLVKNSVVKNLLLHQKTQNYAIEQIEHHQINAQREFGANVKSGLLICKFAGQPAYTCSNFDFYTQKPLKQWGWLGDKFVSNTETYQKNSRIDGQCPFIWRQGIKHDASKIMEFTKTDDQYTNKLGEIFDLESELVYELLKSSDLKQEKINAATRFTVITQKKIGEDTAFFSQKLPKTHRYLSGHASYFAMRKSLIYKGKPEFSIFGIGDYAFKPYKVAISGMYPLRHFSLIVPRSNKAIMLDDTCYYIGFDDKKHAQITQFLLNKQSTMAFLRSIIFKDSKRKITKELLMRINLHQIAINATYEEIGSAFRNISQQDWDNYLQIIKPEQNSGS